MPQRRLFLYSFHRIRSFEHILPYLSRIRFLSFGEYCPRPSESLNSIIGFFPCVEVLKLKLLEVASDEVSGRSSSLSFDLIFATIRPLGITHEALNASSLEGIADPCDFEYFGMCTYTSRRVLAKHQQYFQELREVETSRAFSGSGELSNLSMENGVARCSIYTYPPGWGSSMVARLNGVQWRDCNTSCKIVLERLH